MAGYQRIRAKEPVAPPEVYETSWGAFPLSRRTPAQTIELAIRNAAHVRMISFDEMHREVVRTDRLPGKERLAESAKRLYALDPKQRVSLNRDDLRSLGV